MARIIVFDVNETLLNVRHLEPLFAEAFGDRAALREWFSLLLLHSEVAALAGPYFDFATLARAASPFARGRSLRAQRKANTRRNGLAAPAYRGS